MQLVSSKRLKLIDIFITPENAGDFRKQHDLIGKSKRMAKLLFLNKKGRKYFKSVLTHISMSMLPNNAVLDASDRVHKYGHADSKKEKQDQSSNSS